MLKRLALSKCLESRASCPWIDTRFGSRLRVVIGQKLSYIRHRLDESLQRPHSPQLNSTPLQLLLLYLVLHFLAYDRLPSALLSASSSSSSSSSSCILFCFFFSLCFLPTCSPSPDCSERFKSSTFPEMRPTTKRSLSGEGWRAKSNAVDESGMSIDLESAQATLLSSSSYFDEKEVRVKIEVQHSAAFGIGTRLIQSSVRR